MYNRKSLKSQQWPTHLLHQCRQAGKMWCDETLHRAHAARMAGNWTFRPFISPPHWTYSLFNFSSTFPAYSVETQACILARCARCVQWRSAVFRDTRKNENL